MGTQKDLIYLSPIKMILKACCLDLIKKPYMYVFNNYLYNHMYIYLLVGLPTLRIN